MTRTVRFKNGVEVPALGMGTWNMGDDVSLRSDEIASLQAGLDAGLRVIDTAEMYGNGRSESVVGEAIEKRRNDVFLVSKVLPSNASAKGVLKSCTDSLKRLRTDHMDLYLLHWQGNIPLEETFEAFETLRDRGMIGSWGVSNFDTDAMEEVIQTGQGDGCVANQVLYSLSHRGIEFDLLKENQARQVVTMAYSPLGQGGGMLKDNVLAKIAQHHTTSLGPATPAQIALAWVLRQPSLIAIPKAGSKKHLRENIAAQEIKLKEGDLTALDKAFSPPRKKVALEVI
ncbi:MAG: aldo/keto reductase [Acetobacter aceti]|uniref:Oxidoreductase n=1 Tax=Acetobacter aceti TaxID=435 RepID=A0A1U9KJP8_ACEAC|nr:aldo/keto reductase [Acetobacter aceti]AQS85949.1 oxidoreductase [Acetobacter aceti]